MLALARMGLSEGLWLRAEQQRDGRGRQGRVWISPPGNLYASTLVRLRPDDPPAPGLSLVAGVALAEIISGLASTFRLIMPSPLPGLPGDPLPPLGPPRDVGVFLKWPNDLMLQRAKVAGVLLERAEDAVVIGLGVNVAICPEGLARPVTSLARHGIRVAPEALLINLAALFSELTRVWRAEGLTPIRSAWLAHAHPLDTRLVARLPDGSSVEGFFAGLDGDGALLLRLADGTRRVIHAADVFTL